MLTRNLTTFLFGAKVVSRRPPQLEMAMIVRGTFMLRPNERVAPLEGPHGGLLEQGPLTAEVFAEDDEDRVGGCLYPGDFADHKPHAEVFLVGSCHPASGKPVRECGVRFAVGSWSKTLLVVGDRRWGALGPSKPEPFEKMPLGWDRSFGGPKYEKNPSGKGHGTAELPNVESAAARVLNKSDRPEPAGFGPLNPWWPQRAAKTAKAMHTAHPPYFAKDVDWTRFNAAPPDQQLPGFLRGDEDISLQNLHPSAANFSSRLPALRIRAFAKDAGGSVHEARMNLDTLLVDTDKTHLVLTWRGYVPCAETDLSDVKTVLIASEKLADEPSSAEHYEALLEEFDADPMGVITDQILPGGRKAMEAGKALAKDIAEHPETPPAERALAVLGNEDLMTFGVPEAQRAEALEQLASQRDALRGALAKEKEVLAQRDALLAEKGIPKPPPPPVKTANELAEEAPDVRAQVTESLKKAKAQLETSSAPREVLQTRLAEIEKLEHTLDDPAVQKGLAMASPPRASEIGPGKDLSGRVMTERDFSGLDLSGANFEGAILSGARLAGARLAGANLRRAVLVNADLSGADLSGADLTQALMTSVKAPDADLRRAIMDCTVLGQANLRGAKLGEATLRLTILSGSDLTGASLTGADFFTVFADGALLGRADFTGAKLVKCSFMRCKAEASVFEKAVLTNTTFMGSELREARFVDASGDQASWMKADVGGADFRFAVLHAAHFMDATAVGANFRGCDLRGAEFIRASLERALFRDANLFGAKLEKARLKGTSFLDANLYEARLADAHVEDTIFDGANTKKAAMPS